jgi:hypothetical protein
MIKVMIHIIKHLKENGIKIKRLETDSEQKNIYNEPKITIIPKPQKLSNLFETDKDYKKAFNNIKDIPAKNRPRKLTGFEAHLRTLFHKTVKTEKIKEIISEFKKCNYIEVDNEKMKYNM